MRGMERALRRGGRTVVLLRDGQSESVKAFIHRCAPAAAEYAQMTPLGAVETARWLYIGPSGYALRHGDSVDCGERRFVVETAEAVKVGEETLYWRAVLRAEREAAE